jgi:hypothetical protein
VGPLVCLQPWHAGVDSQDGPLQQNLLHKLVLGKSQGVTFLLSSAQKAKLTRNSPSPRRGAWLSCSGKLDPDLQQGALGKRARGEQG